MVTGPEAPVQVRFAVLPAAMPALKKEAGIVKLGIALVSAKAAAARRRLENCILMVC